MGLFSSDASADDATGLLKQDHRSVKDLFNRFRAIKEDGSAQEKAALVQQICTELTIHAMIEEEIFYPALRAAIDEDDLMDEAEVEHAGAKALIIDLMTGAPGVDQFEAKVTVLGEYVDHHVKEEESEMFPKARKALDVAALGERLAARKAELLAELARESDGDTRARRPLQQPTSGVTRQ